MFKVGDTVVRVSGYPVVMPIGTECVVEGIENYEDDEQSLKFVGWDCYWCGSNFELVESKYQFVRKFYKTTKDIESGNHYREFVHPFAPMTLKEAQIIKPKLMSSPLWIDSIEPIEKDEQNEI